MTRNTLLALVAAAALAGCNNQNSAAQPAEENAVAANQPIELPPPIIGTKLYRCADNSVVTVDYLADTKTANVRLKDVAPVRVTAPEVGQPMTAEGGYSVEGSPSAASAKIALPGKPAQTCKA